MSAIVRFLSLLVVVATVVVNMFALAGLLQGFGLASTDWQAPFSTLGSIYTELAATAYSVANVFINENFGMAMPEWSMHAFVLYASTAIAVAASGMGVTHRETLMGGLGSGGISLSWPLSIWGFVTQAFRRQTVTTFARDHSTIFWLYVLTVVGGYGGARYINANYLVEETAALLRWVG